MKTSERLDKIAEGIRLQQAEMRRLMVDLPTGQTLEIVEAHVSRLSLTIRGLQEEAAQLRQRFRD